MYRCPCAPGSWHGASANVPHCGKHVSPDVLRYFTPLVPVFNILCQRAPRLVLLEPCHIRCPKQGGGINSARFQVCLDLREHVASFVALVCHDASNRRAPRGVSARSGSSTGQLLGRPALPLHGMSCTSKPISYCLLERTGEGAGFSPARYQLRPLPPCPHPAKWGKS